MTMEAVGLAASIGSLATIALQVSKVGYEYINGVKNARADIKQLVDEIASVEKLLEQLHNLYKADKIDDINSFSQLVADFKPFLCQLGDQLRSEPKRRFWERREISKSLKWPFKEKETRQRIERTGRWKSDIILQLQM
jgi:hypothetical protein